MPAFTLRRDGRRRAIFRIEHHVGGLEMVKVLARFNSGGYSYSVGDTLTRVQVLRLLRTLVQEYGTEAYLSEGGWSEDYTDAEAARILHWAAGEIRRLWPDLVDAEFEAYVKDFLPLDELDDADEGDED